MTNKSVCEPSYRIAPLALRAPIRLTGISIEVQHPQQGGALPLLQVRPHAALGKDGSAA
jgi:hypothetical protein